MSNYSFHQMSRQTSFKDYSFMIMTRQQIEERMDELARKYVELPRKYVETRDEKKIVEELYELAGELEKLKKSSLD